MSVVPLESGPADPRAPLEELFGRLQGRFAHAATRCHERSDDEAIHDLRVAARRLEAALDVWRAALHARARPRARGELRKLRRSAGRAREREVSVALLTERLDRNVAAAPAPLVSLLAELRPRVERERAEVARLVSPSRIMRITEPLERVTETRDPVPAARGRARERLERRRQQALERIVSARLVATDGALHTARVAVKKWRYAEEAFAAVAGAPPQPSQGLRELQKVLGEVHDAAVLRDLLLQWADRWRERQRGAEAAALAAVAAEVESERLVASRRFTEDPGPALTP